MRRAGVDAAHAWRSAPGAEVRDANRPALGGQAQPLAGSESDVRLLVEIPPGSSLMDLVGLPGPRAGVLPTRARVLRLGAGTLTSGGATMVATLEGGLGAIRAACERFHVVRLDVFGSVLGDDFEPGRSDIDLLVDFGAMSPYDKPDAYFGLLDELRAILGADVDLVMAGALKNRYIREDVDRTKRVVYAA